MTSKPPGRADNLFLVTTTRDAAADREVRSRPTAWNLLRMAANRGDRSGTVGLAVVDLPALEALQTCLPRGCDLVLLGVSGLVQLAPGCEVAAGELVLWPRGEALTVQALAASSRIAVVAAPAGAEQLLAALGRGDLSPDAAVLLAADAGVELVLPHTRAMAVRGGVGWPRPATAGGTAPAGPTADR